MKKIINNIKFKDEKTFDMLLKKMLFSDLNNTNLNLKQYNINILEFEEYFLKNCKKSLKLAVNLPSIVFLVISLISLSVCIYSSNLSKYWNDLNNEVLIMWLIVYSFVFMFFGIGLLIKRYLFKIKTVYISNGYYKGFKNISIKKYNEIIMFINKSKI